MLCNYCSDYVTLPASNDRIADCVGHAYSMVALSDPPGSGEAAEGRAQGEIAEGEMIGSCDAMLALFRSTRKVAMTDVPVFILGESGTG